MVEFSLPKISFKKKAYVIAYFIDETNHILVAKKKYDQNQFTVDVNGKIHRYIVDPKHILIDSKTREGIHIYHTGNPEPLAVTHRMGAREMDSVSFNQIMEDKVVTDLFSGEMDKRMKLLMILMIVTLALILIGLLGQFGVIKFGTAGA